MLSIAIGGLLVLALLGFFIAAKTGKKPTGILLLDSLSSIISENPKWYLPFTILGLILGFLFNTVLYAFYSLTVIFQYLIIVLQWIYDNILVVLASMLYKLLLMFVALWKWLFEKLIIPFVTIMYEIIVMILDVLLLILRILKHYFVLIPIELLLHAIRAVVPTLKWKNYTKSLVVVSVGMVSIAIFKFIGYLLSMPIIGDIGLFLSMVAIVSWIVGLVTFGSHKEGRKSALFSGVLIVLTVILLCLTFGVNQFDYLHGWAGSLTGFWYSPSIIALTLASIIAVTLVFMTTVGAIYVNSGVDDLSYKQRITGFAKEAFKRAWSFILQPVFIGFIGVFLLIIPYFLLNFSAGNLDKLVDYVVNENSKRLKVELQKNTVSNKIAGSLTDTTINDADFVKIIDTLETEKQLKLKQSENERYANYFKSEIPKIDISAFPVVTSSQLDKEIKDLNKKINDKISVDSKASLESAKMLAQMKNESYYYSYEQIKVFELKMSRTNMLNKSELKSMKDELSFRKSCGLKYGLTLFFFLIGKALIFGLLLTLIINLFGFSVKPIYDMHTSNYLADEVKSTQEKNRLQPWIGILLLGLIIGLFLGNGFGKISGYFVPGKETNKSTQEMNVKSPNSEQESPNQSYDTDVSGPIQDDEMNQVDTPDGEYYAEDFNCFDGSIIPMEYVNNGTCDCGGCEDEGGE